MEFVNYFLCQNKFTINVLVCRFVNVTTDIDECAMNNGGCSPHAFCKNTVPMYTCTCKQGFTGDGTTCHGKSTKACQHVC